MTSTSLEWKISQSQRCRRCFADLLTVHPTKLRIPLDFMNEEEHYSCSIQLTNKTDRTVAYFFLFSWGIDLVSPDEDTYVDTILPRSTSSVTVTVNLLGKEPDPENWMWIDIWASVVKDGVKAEDITRFFVLTDKETRGFYCMPVVYYYSTVVPAANPSSAVPIEEIALTLATPGMSDSKFGPDSDFDDLLTVHPTVLNNLFELNEETLCSIQLTNKTDRIVAYRFRPSLSIHMVSPDANTYVGTILPCSTFSVTVKLGKKPPPGNKEWIEIYAYVVKDGVKAEDITIENVYDLIVKEPSGIFRMPVVYYYVPAADPYSAVPEKKEKGYLPDYNNYINDQVRETTSKGKGLESSVTRQSSNEISSIVLFSRYDIKRTTDDLSVSSKIGHGGYGTVYKGNINDTEVAIKILDLSSQQGIDEFHQEMEILGRTRHPNLVNLIGACLKIRALVYEFLPHGSVEDNLKKNPRLLTWQMRTRIVYDICSAITFLHSIKPEPVVHGDLKPANILLDAKFISKLADFGLCRFLPGGTATVTFLETKNIKGTEWYIDPDFLETGKLTRGCDVYSFGITMLRILTGAPAAEVYRKVERAIRKKSLMAIVDSIAGEWPKDVAEFLAYMGLECCGPERESSKLMKDISTGLKDILAKIDT